MFLRPKSSPRHHATPVGAASAVPLAPVPAWLRRAIPNAQGIAGQDLEDVALTARLSRHPGASPT